MKRYFLSIVLILSTICVWAQPDFVYNGLKYHILDRSRKTVSVIGTTNPTRDVVIPDLVLSSQNIAYYVTEIANGSINGSFTQTITIPKYMEYIEPGALVLPYLETINLSEHNTDFEVVDGVLYDRSKSTLLVYPCNKQDEEFYVPNSVTKIGEEAFCSNRNLTYVYLPNSIMTIGKSAFSGVQKLSTLDLPSSLYFIEDEAFYTSTITNISIPNSVLRIGKSAFQRCSHLTSVTLPSKITTIEEGLFGSCSSLTSISIPTSVASIGDFAFFDCKNMTTVTMGNSVTEIGCRAFYGCTLLKDVTFSSTLKAIGQEAFSGCISFEHITLPNSVQTIDSHAFWGCKAMKSINLGNSLSSIKKYTFSNCTSLTDVKIPNTVTTIEENAFYGCPLTAITLPSSLTSIGEYVFYGNKLEEVICNATKAPVADYSCFYDVRNILLFVPSSSIDCYRNTEPWKDFKNIFATGSEIVTQNNITYYCNTSSKTATLYDGKNFSGDLVIPETVYCNGTACKVTSIANKAFNDDLYTHNTQLKSVTFPNTITTIGDFAFQLCDNLKEITLPNSLTDLAEYAFYGCPLEIINIGSQLTSISHIMVIGYDLEAINVSSDNRYLSSQNGILFNKDKSILIRYPSIKKGTEYIIPNSVRTIGYEAFSSNGYLKSVTVSNSVTSIGEGAFSNTQLESFSLPASVTSIPNRMFDSSRITSIELPNTVKSIGDEAFGNTSLKAITIPASVKTIGVDAFRGSEIREITCEATDAPVVGANAFYNNYTDNCVVFVPQASINNYKAAEQWREFNNFLAIGAESGQVSFDKIIYSFDRNLQTAAVDNGRKADEYSTYVTIRDYLEFGGINYKVTKINDKAFSNNKNIIKVNIPYGIKEIGDAAFSDCSGLTSVNIPNSVTSIGEQAFKNCTNLASVTIGSSVMSIGILAFINCHSLTSFVVNNRNEYYCTEDNVLFNKDKSELLFCVETKNGDYIVPNSVTSIGYYAFKDCSMLTSVGIPNTVVNISDGAFYECKSLSSVDIPNFVTSIGSFAFYNCFALTSVNIPNSVTSIGNSAFRGCSHLKEVICYAKDVPTTGDYVFNKNNVASATLMVPAASVEKYKAAEQWKEFGTILPITDNIEIIASGKCGDNLAWALRKDGELTIEGNGEMDGFGYTFKKDYSSITSAPWGEYCEDVISVVIKEGVTNVGAVAFYNCSTISSVSIPNSVKNIESDAFAYCTNLKSVTIPNSVTRIGQSAFAGCTNLTSITLSESLESIGYLTFSGCTSLTSVVIPNSVINVEGSAFDGCTSIKEPLYNDNIFVMLPKDYDGVYSIPKVLKIGDSAFANCTGLTAISIPNSVTSIGWSAFSGCSELVSINLPNSVISIGSSAFSNCKSIKYPLYNDYIFAKMPEDYIGEYTVPFVSVIADGAFAKCAGLESVVIPNSITNIGYGVFRDCTDLISVSIPNSVTSIESYAFYGCTGLATVTIPSSVTSIHEVAFANCTNLKDVYYSAKKLPDLYKGYTFENSHVENATLHVPASVIDAFRTTAPWSEFGNIVPLTAEEEALGIDNVQTNGAAKAYCNNGTIIVKGLRDGEEVRFFSLDGKMIGKTRAAGSEATFSVPQGIDNIVITKFGNSSMKVKVRG